MAKEPGKHSVPIGRRAWNAVIVAGDHSTVTQTLTRGSQPPPESVDIKAELAALRTALAQRAAPCAGKIENAIGEAQDELQKPTRGKDQIGKALDRAIGYDEKAERFATAAEKLVSQVMRVAGWQGTAGVALLKVLDLTV